MPKTGQTSMEDTLYFLTYAHILNECLPGRTQIFTVKLLLEWITLFPGSENPKTQESLLINNDFVLDLEQHTRDVPQYLKDFASQSDEVKAKAKGHFEDVLKEVVPVFVDTLCSRLLELSRKSHIADVTINGWEATYKSGDYAQFLADVFLFALQVKAPTISKKAKKAAADAQLENDIVNDSDRLDELLARLVLTPIRKPPQIAKSEQPFIKPLYGAYGSIDGKVYASKSELPLQLQEDLEIRRDHFYSAETVRIQGAKALGAIAAQEYSTLENEVFHAAYDVCTDEYKNGFVRMKKVMMHIVSMPNGKSIYFRTKWIGPEEKQGICHQLSGKDRLKWVMPDE